MATSLTSSYAGEYKDKMIASALLSGRTLANGGLTVYPNVAFKEVIKRVDLGGDLIVPGACDYSDAGTVTIDEAILEVKEYQINKTECKKTFSQDWIAAQMGYSMNNQNLPKSYSDFIVQQYIAKIAEFMENQIWTGNGSGGNLTGFTTTYAASASSLMGGAVVTGTTVDASNVVTEIGKVVDHIAANKASLLDKEDLHIYVSNSIF